MADLLKSGMEFLESQRHEFMTQLVTYRRGNDSVNLKATIGKTQFQVIEESGSQVGAEVADFIVMTTDLKLFGVQIFPKLGDKIETGRAVYEVLYLAGDGCWRYSCPYGTSMRIHTKQVS